MLVSVLTPSFNQGRWIGDNLRSVSCQTYPRIEHVVMDGGSTDNTLAVLRDFGEDEPSVTWRSEPDNGQAHAVNKALLASKGDIIGWLNSDDAYFNSTVVECVVDTFAKYPSVDVVYGHAALVNGDGLILHALWVPRFQRRVFRHINFIPQPTAFVRRSALGMKMLDESFDYAMDRELWLRLGVRGKVKRIPRALAIDRHHSMRKVMNMHDVAEADTLRLDVMYAVNHRHRAYPAAVRFSSGAARIFGLRLLPQMRGDLAFDGHIDSWLALCKRQVAVRRSAMPMGG